MPPPLSNLLTLAASVVGLGLFVHYLTRLSDDPRVWEQAIRQFEQEDQSNPPPPGMIVFTGSSSIRFWDSLQEDMLPLPVVNRGFGGSQIHQVTYYADRIILPYQPRAVVFHAGENDLAGVFFSRRKTPGEVREAFRKFCEKIHARFTALPIYFISIKPPQARWIFWPAMQAVNAFVREDCAADPRLHFIDIVPAMLDTSGNPRRDIFQWDGIHLNRKGYAIWTSVVKPILVEAFLEKRAP